jgi:hypothetical protein
MDTPLDNTDRLDRRFSNEMVDARLRALDPPADWEPATGVALARFHGRVAAAPATWSAARAWWPWLLTAGLACLLLTVMPATRAMAQRVWDIIWVGRVAVVTMDVDKLPSSLTAVNVHVNMIAEHVATPAEAASLAQFTPRLPDSSVLAARPTFSVLGPLSFVSTVKAADLQAAVDREGVSDRSVPREWDGATIALHTSALVTAEYPDLQVVQCLPLAITTPPGFDFGAFSETLLRIVGLTPTDAHTFATQMVRTPVWILPIAPDEVPLVRMRQVSLRTGQGTLIHDDNESNSAERVTLIWSVSDRIYVISANASDDRVIEIANAIP